MKLQIGKKVFPCIDYAGASMGWAVWRDTRNLGSSRSPQVQVIEDDGTVRAVSYNGKVWPRATVREWQSGDEPLYSPY